MRLLSTQEPACSTAYATASQSLAGPGHHAFLVVSPGHQASLGDAWAAQPVMTTSSRCHELADDPHRDAVVHDPGWSIRQRLRHPDAAVDDAVVERL